MNSAAIARLVILCSLFACDICAQSPPSPQQDRSFNLGEPVSRPEDLSGIWEAPDGHGGNVGLHLILDTTTPTETRTLAGISQKWLGLSVTLYHRTGSASQISERNTFSDSPRGGGARYQNSHLTLHWPGYDLDLRQVANGSWSGRFHREDFDANVMLNRPSNSSSPPWFVGTWKITTGADTTCVHIAQSSPRVFLAWSDKLSAWGLGQSSPQLPKPPYSWQRYGDLVGIEPAAKNSVWVEFGTGSPLCCPHRFLATPAGSKSMSADWPTGLNQSAHKSRWMRMPGDSCIAPAP